MSSELDHQFMMQALEQAKLAAQAGEVPVGAVLVHDGKVISKAFNRPIGNHDPSAHAEMLALRSAAGEIENYRLPGSTLYVTLEPCVMCAGALLNARVSRVVIGASDEKAGAVGSRYNLLSDPRLLHEADITYDVLSDESAVLLRDFFATRRP